MWVIKIKFLRLKGGTKEQRKVVTKFLDYMEFEKVLLKIQFESVAYGIPFKETKNYKALIKIIEKGD